MVPIAVPGIDVEGLTRWLAAAARLGPIGGPLTVDVIAGGRSNLTYRVDDGDRTWVLRRGPLGHALPTAHSMRREWTVLSAVAGTDVPVPRVVATCDDETVIGSTFYLMDYVDGRVIRDAQDAARLSPGEAAKASSSLASVLAAIHRVDWRAVGLASLSRPGGFMARQLDRWADQWHRSATRELPALMGLHGRLAATLPVEAEPCLVHGDLRLDNVILDNTDTGTICAVVDWEMATIGDALADLGTLLMYWCPPSRTPIIDIQAVTAGPGFASRDELCGAYIAAGGRSLDSVDWYVAFAYFKLAVIVEGIHARHLAGETVGAGFDTLGGTVPALVAAGHDVLNAVRAA